MTNEDQVQMLLGAQLICPECKKRGAGKRVA